MFKPNTLKLNQGCQSVLLTGPEKKPEYIKAPYVLYHLKPEKAWNGKLSGPEIRQKTKDWHLC